jgi:hypothetical protein
MSPSIRANDEKVTTTGTSTSAATASANSIQPFGRLRGRGKAMTPRAGVIADTASVSDKMAD